jgi:hypothetical protein
MKVRILIAALALVFGFTTLARADKEEFAHKGHKLKAVFPTASKHIENKADSKDGKVATDLYLSARSGKAYMVMVVEIDGKKVLPADMANFMKEFITGMDRTYKNAKSVMDGEIVLNKNCPSGHCYLVQHDGGRILLWATAQHGKAYITFVSADTQKELNTDDVKAFLDSIEIEKN